MRPIATPTLPDHLFPAPRGALLLGALGAYCSVCERPVPAEFWVLDAATGRVHEPMETQGWGGLLLLCHGCTAAHRDSGGTVEGLLLPGGEATFRLANGSPFVYALEEVTVVLLDEAGEPASSEAGERVIVRGTTPGARATIGHFALNTAYFDEAAAEFRVPYREQSTRLDRRVDQRTEAWRMAERLAARLERGGYAPALLEQGRDLLAAQGFWSTAATVLWARLDIRERLAGLLLPDDAPLPAPLLAAAGAISLSARLATPGAPGAVSAASTSAKSPAAAADAVEPDSAEAASATARAACAFTRITAFPGTRADWL